MLGEHIEILSGYAFKSKEFNDDGHGIPVVRIRDVGKKKSNTFYNGKYSKDYLLDNGDFLIGMDGEFRLAKWYGGKALLNQRVCKIIPNSSSLDSGYMYYMVPRELKKIEDSTSFATVKHLSVKKIKDIKIPLPSLDQQKKIAAILDAADAYRQKTKALIEKYDELTQSLFLDMFGDRNKFKRVALETVVSNKKDFVDGPFGSNLKVSDQTSYGVRLIQINNIGVGQFRDKTQKFTSEEKYQSIIKHNVKPNDIVIAKMGEPLGRACIVPDFINKGLVVADCMRIRVSLDNFSNYFVMFFLNSDDAKRQINNLSHGSTRIRINLSMLRKLEIPLPPLDLQNQFAETVQTIEEQKTQAQASLAGAEDLFNSLLQRAFKGELTRT